MAPSSPSAKEDTFNEDDVSSLDQDMPMVGTNMFKRQVSAPVRLSKGMFMRQVSAPVHRLSICEESVPDLSEPEWEPDEDDLDVDHDPFQSISGPGRQISIISDGPCRQVSAMSNFSSQDWEPIGLSSIKRQGTDEQWPTWRGKDPLIDGEQLGPAWRGKDPFIHGEQLGSAWRGKDPLIDGEQLDPVSHGSEESAKPYMNMWMPPKSQVDTHAMPAMFPQLYIWQLPPQAKPDSAFQPPFRKRESLIDLAKQQQEQQAVNEDAPKSSSMKFCPWCGGSIQPNFKFCVFCGNAFSARTNNA
jgi:hypothetical protein